MPLLEWRDEFSLGIEEVDHEHRTLIGFINESHGDLVKGSPTPRISAFLAEVHARIAAHFALEEKVMRQRRYDGYVEHKADHEDLLDEIRDIMDAYESGGYVDAGGDLGETLAAWFGRHFRTHDARFHGAMGPKAG